MIITGVITKQGFKMRASSISMWINLPPVRNLAPRIRGMKSELSNALVAENKQKEEREREREPRTRDQRGPRDDFSKMKNQS